MKNFFKAVVLSCAVWAMGAAVSSSTVQAFPVQDGPKIQINDSLVSFPEVSPFVNESGTMLVPIRPVAEQMGYHVDWSLDGSQIRLTLKNNDRSIELTTGNAQALVNGRQLAMASPAVFTDGHVFIPVRFISESFGYMVQWDDHNGIAIICKDGKYHAPAWWAHAAPVQASTPDKVVSEAKSLVGVPYVWGGTTPSGFDCSGFVNYVYNKQGVDLPRTSREMLDQAGTGVAPSSLKPGDLVFFNINQSIEHVGIYLGNDSFISATSKGIHVDTLTDKYWGPKYIGAKRVS